jgi:hypothetical protein
MVVTDYTGPLMSPFCTCTFKQKKFGSQIHIKLTKVPFFASHCIFVKVAKANLFQKFEAGSAIAVHLDNYGPRQSQFIGSLTKCSYTPIIIT